MSFGGTFALLAAVPLYMIVMGYVTYLIAERSRTPREGTAPELFYVLVIPALNEELVIANTIRHLLTLPGDNYLIFIVDDASDDRTAAVVESFASDKVRLSSRHFPIAREGKGAVLNHAYHAILTSELPEIYGLDNIVFTVMDADCEVESNLFSAISPYFRDPKTSGVQTGVRMMNGDENAITLWQQCEFTTFNWVFSRGHETLGSASLGGNGQFVRLSALTSLGGQPWTNCLTEDLDIGLRLAVLGWVNHYCHTTRVHQQAVSSFRRLLRQRARWFQGHISCWRHARAVVTSRMPLLRKIDILNYLIAPILTIPLGLFSIFALGLFLLGIVSPLLPGDLVSVDQRPVALAAWYLLGLGTAPLCAIALHRDGQAGWGRAFALSHLYVLGGYIWFLAGLVATWNTFKRSAGWAKTTRTALPDILLLEAPKADRGPQRYLSTHTSVRWLHESQQLLPLRTENFLPRSEREGIAGATFFETPVAGPTRLDGHLLMARSEAHLRRLEEVLAANGIAPPRASAVLQVDEFQIDVELPPGINPGSQGKNGFLTISDLRALIASNTEPRRLMEWPRN
ncbi:MAG: glycosyltransferase family 2 protein [Dehalococcoidia bacterium]